MNTEEDIVPNDKILRVATDSLKVNKALRDYTVDARVGGDVNENNRLVKKAQERVKSSKIVFTTCAGAGLGILRKVNFEIVIIDEASQITEACALIPLVKGCKKAILVGDQCVLLTAAAYYIVRLTVDHSQRSAPSDGSKDGQSVATRRFDARTTVHGPRRQGNVQDDAKRKPSPLSISWNATAALLSHSAPCFFIFISRVQVQYRFPRQLAVFPSNEFYQGRLKTGMRDAPARLAVLKGTKFPWPTEHAGVVVPIVFVQCGSEEDMGGMSKGNAGQAEVVQKVIKLLTTREEEREGPEPKSDPKGKGKAVDRGPVDAPVGNDDGASGSKRVEKPKITVLTPYTKQVSELKSRVPNDVDVFTIDSFQGRESDLVIFSTVRCNVERDIGFVEDERRLNVMWTRAKLALVIVGDRATLTEMSGLWKRALDSCVPVTLPSEDLEAADLK